MTLAAETKYVLGDDHDVTFISVASSNVKEFKMNPCYMYNTPLFWKLYLELGCACTNYM